MSSRVVVSRLGKVGAVLRCKHRPCVWALTAVWNRGYSQGRNITGPADLAHKQSTAMNAPWTGKNIYAEKVAPVTAKIIAPLRTWLSEAAEAVDLSPGQTLTICDYGSADGRASSLPIQDIVGVTRRRFGSQQNVMVVNEDQPENEFGPIFLAAHGLLPDSPSPCLKDDPNVFVTACGTSFHSQCLPDNTVHIGIANSSLHFLSAIPCKLKNAMYCHYGGSEEELSMWREVARTEWERLLLHRAKEMVKGGFLAINTFTVIPGSAARDFTPYPATNPEKGRPLLDLMQEILDDMVKDRHITQEEAEDVNIPVYARTEEEVRAPFLDPDSPVRKAGLEIVETKQQNFDCLARLVHQKDFSEFDGKHFAKTLQQMSRPGAMSVLMSSFTKRRQPQEALALADEYYERLEEKVAADPENYGIGMTKLYTLITKK